MNEEMKEKIVEEKRTKKKKRKTPMVVFLVFVLMIVAALLIALQNVGILDFSKIDFSKLNRKEKVTLNYTTPNHQQKEGVYITDVSEVVEEVMPSIVAITSKTLVNSGNYGPFYFWGGGSTEKQYATGAGSGIIIKQTDDELLILTNDHVIDGAEELSVQFYDEKSYDAVVKGTSADDDVAVISVKLSSIDNDTLESIKIATIGDSNELKVGNGVIAIGNALGYGQSVTSGVVSALNREVTLDDTTRNMIQMDAAINGGNSGGALLNSKGEVVGICEAKYSSSSSSGIVEGMSLAIPITDVKDVIEKLMNGETPTASGAQIGIKGNIVNQDNTLGMPQGFYISEVISGTGADDAGLSIGSIVTKIEGNKVTSLNDMKKVLSKKKPGDVITITVAVPDRRSYTEKDVEVTLS
ncbi:MAG: trypsin-like peptidase domain-containing protein [Bacilli bacterium]|nr:trypsin-like peptidase domain-containing protein [Bacilli bacterium]